MKIGIDARPLSHDLTGIGRYTLNILENIFTLHKSIEWYLYSDKPIMFEFHNKNIHIRTGKYDSFLKGTLFSQVFFPYWAAKDELNVFWSPRHHLPMLLHFSKEIKKVVTVHDIVWKKHPETMSKYGLMLEKILFLPSIKIADNIITVSNFTQTELNSEFLFTKDKTSSTPLQSFIPKYKLNSISKPSIEGKYILFVGTLEPRKNLKNLLYAFKLIQKYDTKLQLVIVGKDGWGDTNLQKIISSLNLENNIKITGFISDNDLLSLYKYCEILAMPSIYEGFGLPALEALSLNKKVVISQFNAISELKGDNVFVTDIDAKSIAKTIKLALDSNPKNLAQVGRKWDNIAEKTLNILTQPN